MKCNFILVVWIILSLQAKGQASLKNDTALQPIDLAALGTFPYIANVAVTSDGRFVSYSTNYPAKQSSTFEIKSLDDTWSYSTGRAPSEFTYDGQYALFKKEDNTLVMLRLADHSSSSWPDVQSFKIQKDGSWIAFLQKSNQQLVLKNMQFGKELRLDSVVDYRFATGSNALVVLRKESGQRRVLRWFDLAKESTSDCLTLEAGQTAESFTFSSKGMAFQITSLTGKSVYYYDRPQNQCSLLADNAAVASAIGEGVTFDGINYYGFSKDGEHLFLTLKELENKKPKTVDASVDVWTYRDSKLQSQQLKELKPKSYVAIITISDKKLYRLEGTDDHFRSYSNGYALVANIPGDATYDEWYWNSTIESSITLVSLRDGSQKKIGSHLAASIADSYTLSPGGRYVVYYDPVQRNYFSYETTTGQVHNISRGISQLWTRDDLHILMSKYLPVEGALAGWLKDDQAVLIYDRNDLYQLDLSGKKGPINLTKGYGKEKDIELRAALENQKIYAFGDTVILSAFNRMTKDDGFYRICLGDHQAPQRLTMGPYMYKGTWENDQFVPAIPIKASNANVFIVQRMTEKEAPNFFWTRDFQQFHPITNNHPEQAYNWLTTELISWTTDDGVPSKAVLFKPKDFDPKKKYPLIIHYYEKFTGSLHGFFTPDYCNGEINIPYFVSNGYLICVPDMHYTLEHPGHSVVSTVVSLAHRLSGLPYIDARHMGLQGHSRGGWETNFIVTHSTMFAAAMSSCGMSNYISLYDGIRALRRGVSKQPAFEVWYQRIGATLWEKPDLFIENSPIFRAHKVTTPLLMMANIDDTDVPFDQGLEFFTALRRLGKKAWMLQYDGGDHLIIGKAARDLTIRMKQFFDYYLKQAPAPKWMIEGIPAKLKGWENGFELEPSTVQPKAGITRGGAWKNNF